MSDKNKKFQQPGAAQTAPVVPPTFQQPVQVTEETVAQPAASYHEHMANWPSKKDQEVKDAEGTTDLPDAAPKADVKPAAPKKIVVIALKEIPSFKGDRIPEGMEFEILPEQFNEKLMVKKVVKK